MSFISNYKKLPNAGNDAIYVINGSIIDGKTRAMTGGATDAKSIDFYWECGEKKFYAFHKYTREGGGAQDNQYSDIKKFIENANASADTNTFFIAIADGEYFNTRNGQAGISKIENLKQMSNSQRGVFAVQIADVYDLLKSICGM